MMLRDNLEGWEAEGGGGGIRGRAHMYTCGHFLLMNGKNHHNIVIILQLTIKYKKRLQKEKKWLIEFYNLGLLFSHLVESDSSQPHGLMHARFLWPSPSSRVCPSSYPLHW